MLSLAGRARFTGLLHHRDMALATVVLSLLCGAGPVLPERAIGGVFLTRETPTEIELTLRFGQRALNGAPSLPADDTKALLALKVPVTLEAPLFLWDSKGLLLTLGTPRLLFRFSCENDGGLQAQAIGKVVVKKASLKRPLTPNKEAWNVVGFAVVGTAVRLPPLAPSMGNVYFSADLDGDGKVDASLSGGPDDAMNCGEPTKKGPQWSVRLEADEDNTASLRCCGP